MSPRGGLECGRIVGCGGAWWDGGGSLRNLLGRSLGGGRGRGLRISPLGGDTGRSLLFI